MRINCWPSRFALARMVWYSNASARAWSKARLLLTRGARDGQPEPAADQTEDRNHDERDLQHAVHTRVPPT